MKGYTSTKGFVWAGLKKAMIFEAIRYTHKETGSVSVKYRHCPHEDYQWAGCAGDMVNRFHASQAGAARGALANGRELAAGIADYFMRNGIAV